MAGGWKRLWGWYFFDWASQPYNTLLLTFIFGPYVTELLGDGSRAQAVWGYGVGAAGLIIAVSAPVLGAIADRSGGRMRFVALFSVFYVIGAAGLWLAAPGDFPLLVVLGFFVLGLIGMEFATIFTNAMLPDLGPRERIGRISGTGWAMGYVGGLLALILMLTLFAESAATGKTLIGIAPILGLDPEMREGTRAVGPLTAIWYLAFMVPFFAWLRDVRPAAPVPVARAARTALPDLLASLRRLPRAHPSLTAYLASSMLYRDALNGMYVFGGIYAAGVLGWSVTDVGVFGILAVVTGAVFAWAGGHADDRFGPKRVIVAAVAVLALVAIGVTQVDRATVFGLAVGPESRLPDLAFYLLGATIGAAGGVLQSASRTMMVRQAIPGRVTEGFGLYALAGKATSFLAPLAIGITTDLTGSQQAGILPLVALFTLGLLVLTWVRPEGDG